MNRKDRFEALWARMAGGAAAPVWAVLDRAYADRSRGYHNWDHIGAMLAELDAVRGEAEFVDVHFGEAELAIFFHDAVYEPLAKDNEARSAELFRGVAGGMAEDAVRRIEASILATATHAPVADLSTRLVLDLDLCVLGAGAEDYARYARSVRAEYAAVPDAAWRAGRPAVLRRFLAREAIYQTVYFHSRLEARARENMAAEIAALES